MPRTAQQYADELLANNLATGRTVVEAARAAGVSERTAYRRMKEPTVRARITEVRRAALDTVAGRLTQGMVSACDHLTELVEHDNPHVQIRAAKTVLQLALQVRRAVDVEDRLDRLGEQTRLSPVGPALADAGPRSVALEPGKGPVERAALSGRDGNVDPSTEGEIRPGAPASATGGGNEMNMRDGSDCGDPATPARSPAPDESGRTPRALSRDPETGAHRSGRSISRGVVVLGLVLAAGLSFTATGTARTPSEPEPDDRVQTCQNLPEPANRFTSAPAPGRHGERLAENVPPRARARTVGRNCLPESGLHPVFTPTGGSRGSGGNLRRFQPTTVDGHSRTAPSLNTFTFSERAGRSSNFRHASAVGAVPLPVRSRSAARAARW